tara:strand:+ start:1630 stop:2061 length:432 start_codon:yes stop_codon:yes gene_type:complete
MTKILDASYRAKQDKINYGVNNMGYGVKSCKNNTITEIEIPQCSICKQYFYFLQDDAIVNTADDVISRCMTCYGDKYGIQHLMLMLKDIGGDTLKNRTTDTGIPLVLLWEYPKGDVMLKDVNDEWFLSSTNISNHEYEGHERV